MKTNAKLLLILLVLLLASFLAWDTVNRRPLRREQNRQFTLNRQPLDEESGETDDQTT